MAFSPAGGIGLLKVNAISLSTDHSITVVRASGNTYHVTEHQARDLLAAGSHQFIRHGLIAEQSRPDMFAIHVGRSDGYAVVKFRRARRAM